MRTLHIEDPRIQHIEIRGINGVPAPYPNDPNQDQIRYATRLRNYCMARARVHRDSGNAESLARCVRSARAWNRQILERRALRA